MDQAPQSSRGGLPYSPKVLALHLELLQYPILARTIRLRMRDEIFDKGMIDRQRFYEEVQDKAVQSQQREMIEPGSEEPVQDWERRFAKMEAILTEYYFARNFSRDTFAAIVDRCLAKRGAVEPVLYPNFNPEIAPFSMLFAHANMYERLPEEQRGPVAHQLREILVVLTKGMISDQLSYLSIARGALETKDLEWVRDRRIGRGKIGGKAGGLVLARKVLCHPEPDDPPELKERLRVPDSWFLGSDVFSEFLLDNGLTETTSSKYRDYQQNREEYPAVQDRFVAGRLPAHCRQRLGELLDEVGSASLIVRSSSLLEDNFGIAFAGKYDSFFCPNQASAAENLEALCRAIKRVYASALSPDALVYRQQRGLIDYDERMAVLLQTVQGSRVGDYFFPLIAGVGFSHNPIVWNPRINRSDGFLRIVAGLGTRAVDRVEGDYARMVALSHPTLQPGRTVREVVQYSQRHLDVLNLAANSVESIPTQALIDLQVPNASQIASLYRDGDLHPMLSTGLTAPTDQLVLTFDGLLKDRTFTTTIRGILKKLERRYKCPVDIEFTVERTGGSQPGFTIHLLQCRQQSRRDNDEIEAAMPADLPEEKVLFVSRRMVTSGTISNVRYVIYVDPEAFRKIDADSTHVRLAKAIGRLNARLDDGSFVLIGPGRWGSSNRQLGVPVTFADIFNAKALIEVALGAGEQAAEASYGTHFFQDLVESGTYPLPIYPNEEGAQFNFSFFRNSPSILTDLLPSQGDLHPYLRVIDLEQLPGKPRLEIVMNAQQAQAMGYLK
ncbi:MAG: hypothetical protein DRI90_07600 [Deltaproteobacteria bacterium]|nr:MAG: hypothetical protein DRI90_07600 [Deltaproteobacteria bacterium]